MRHALPADADFSLYSPVSPGRVLQTPEEEDHTRILMAWALALALTVALGIGLQHAPWIGPTISIAGAEDVASLSPPTLLFGLLTLWLGLEWGYVGACASGTLLLWYAGLPGHVAALLSVFDALALVPLAVSFRVAPVPTSLRGPFAWAFFLLVSVLCALLGSTGEILRTLLLDGVMVDSLPAWHGGWVGPFCQLVFITGPLLWWLSPRVGRWKAERGLVSPWAPPDQALLGTSLLAGAALISLFMLGSRQMAGDALDLALGLGLPGQELPPAQVTQIRDAFGKLDIIPALSVSIMACAALSLYRLTVSWSTTARANADALRASEARMTALVDAIPDLVLRFRPDGTVLDLKDGLGLLGQGDRVGQSITEFWPSRVAHPLLGRAEDALAYGTSVVEFRLESEMGLREYEARIVATGKDDVVAIVRDVTQQRELVRLKAELVHSIGQNMRTPINSVQGALGLIRGGAAGPVPARVEQLINLAYRNTERLVTLSEEVANMAPRQTGDTSFFLEPVNLRTLVEASVAAARGAGRRTRAVVDLIARDEEAEVLGDPDRIGMVLDAILSNALKFSPSRGRVEVTLARLSEAWRVQVRDEGSGIPEAFRPQVFRMVGRGPDQPASSLARARDMVLQLGGRIGFESRVGKGSTFWFELPEISHAERDDQKPRGNKSKSSSNLAAASGRHMRKLLLDEDEDSSDSPSAPDPESKDVESNHHGTLPPAAGELPEHEDLPRRGR